MLVTHYDPRGFNSHSPIKHRDEKKPRSCEPQRAGNLSEKSISFGRHVLTDEADHKTEEQEQSCTQHLEASSEEIWKLGPAEGKDGSEGEERSVVLSHVSHCEEVYRTEVDAVNGVLGEDEDLETYDHRGG